MSGRSHQRNWSWILGIRERRAEAALALAIMLLAGLTTTPTQAQMYSFPGAPNGAQPWGRLVRDGQGNLYGTTEGGGINGGGGSGHGGAGLGTVFKLDATGQESVLYAFTGGGDGGIPEAGLVRDPQGNLYGTTVQGGAFNNGVVFKVEPKGKETVLYSFTGGADGAAPVASLVRDLDGNLYGVASGGGAFGSGVVFKLDASGNETVLYSFTGGGDGAGPGASLLRDALGNLYGTTLSGGTFGRGTVFKVDPTGNETVLYSFTGGADGGSPYAGLVQDRQGNLYGTTFYGGNPACSSPYSWGGCGTVFKLDVTGKVTVLHSFTGLIATGIGGDGANPYGGLVRDAQHNLYGTTFYGGNEYCGPYSLPGCGTVFMVGPTGLEVVIYAFPGGTNGANPAAGLVRDEQGTMYGSTYVGGDLSACYPVGCGTLFNIQVSPTTTTLTSSLNPSTYGWMVTFYAQVTSSAGPPPDGATVTFMTGTKVLGSGTTYSGGTAMFFTSNLPGGVTKIRAVYGGDPNRAGSVSNTLRQVVERDATAIALSSSPNPSIAFQPVTFTAAFDLNESPSPDGETVTFMSGNTILGTGTVSLGYASAEIIFVKAGIKYVRAVYGGDLNLKGSTSKLVEQVVKKAGG